MAKKILYTKSLKARIEHASIQSSHSKVSSDLENAYKDENLIKLELMAVVINMR